MTIPTFTDAPLESLPPAIVALKLQLEELDKEHAWSTSPTQRRAIEQKMAAVRREIAVEKEEELAAERRDWPFRMRMELELRKADRERLKP